MRTLMKAAILVTVFTALMASPGAYGAQISIGIQIGSPPPPVRVVHVIPARPAADYYWIDGYWYPSGKKYKWRDGYWARPPYAGALWVVPRYSDGRYFSGYWVSYDKHPDKPGTGRGRGRGHR